MITDYQIPPVKNVTVIKNIQELIKKYPVADEHRKILQSRGCDFVYAELSRRPGPARTVYGFALARFNKAIENQFGIIHEVLFFYAPHDDMYSNTYNYIVSNFSKLEKESKRKIARDIFFIHSPDINLSNKLSNWKNFGTLAIPLLTDSMDDTAVSIFKLLEDNVYSRNLFSINSAVSGDNFFGRHKILQELVGDISIRKPTGIFGLRKSGKTSVMNKISEILDESYIVAFTDLETLPAPPINPSIKLTEKILKSILKSIDHLNINTKFVSRYLENPDVQKFENILNRIILKLDEKGLKLVLLLDEIEYLYTDQNKEEKFFPEIVQILGILRSAVQENNNFMFIVAGLTHSIFQKSKIHGIHNPLFSWATPRYLGPFTKMEANDLAKSLGAKMGIRLTEGGLNALFEATSGHAFLYRSLAAGCADRLPIDSADKRVINSSLVMATTDEWQLDYSGNFKQILSQVEEYYPGEYYLLQCLEEFPEDFDEIAKTEKGSLKHLIDLGLIEKLDGSFQTSMLLEWI